MRLPDTLIEYAQLPPLLPHQLEHQYHCQHLGLDCSVFGLHSPPQFLLICLDNFGKYLLMLFESKRRVEVRDEIDELAGRVLAWREQKVLQAVGEGDLLLGVFLHAF
jgi:hypothetical protein